MIIDGATIYNDGVGLGHDCEKKIRQIMTTLKTLSPSSKLSMRLLKSGRRYEALIWGTADDLPFGMYNRGPSLAHILDFVYNKVKKKCLSVWNASGRVQCKRSSAYNGSARALAG